MQCVKQASAQNVASTGQTENAAQKVQALGTKLKHLAQKYGCEHES